MTDSFFVHFERIVRCFGKPKSVVIPSTVREIGEWAFDSVSSLLDLGFEDGVERIRLHAFAHCAGLRAVAFPESLVAIEEFSFTDCRALCEVAFAADSKLQYIGKGAFGDDPLESVILPASVTEIDPGAFSPEV
jgi:hypothetical protein